MIACILAFGTSSPESRRSAFVQTRLLAEPSNVRLPHKTDMTAFDPLRTFDYEDARSRVRRRASTHRRILGPRAAHGRPASD